MVTQNSCDYQPTQYNVLSGGASGTINNIAPSTSGYVLTSNGASLQPTFQVVGSSSITITGDSGGGLTGNSFTLTGGATGLTFAGAGSTETLGGTLIVANGGTGASTLTGVLTGNGTSTITAHAVTQHGVVIGGASNAVGSTSVGATGTVLIGNTGADPTFSATPSVTSITLGSGSALGTYIQAGSWTPILAFGGLSTGITYSFQAGEYTQIGNVVYFSCLLVLSNVGSATGAASIGGLPVSIGNASYGSIQQPNNLAFTATYNEAYWAAGGIGLGLIQFGSLAATPYSTNAVLTNANFINNTNLQFSGFYFTS